MPEIITTHNTNQCRNQGCSLQNKHLRNAQNVFRLGVFINKKLFNYEIRPLSPAGYLTNI